MCYGEQESVESNPVKLGRVSFNLVSNYPSSLTLAVFFKSLKVLWWARVSQVEPRKTQWSQF